MRKLTLGQFKVQAIIANAQDFYDYSKSIYLGDSKKLVVVCPDHGDFECTPSNHKRGKGCPSCKIAKIGAKKSKGIDHFLSKAKDIHGDRYDYSLVRMTKCRDKVIIICKSHGEFTQSAAKHLLGRGCHSCANNQMLTKQERINQAISVHGNTYSYDYLPDGFSNKVKVDIECQEHGLFKMTFADHVYGGHGCPACKGKTQKQAYINLISDNENPLAIKFGIANDHKRRLKKQGRESKFDVSVLGVWVFESVNNCKTAECEVKKSINTGLMCKEDMPDGYTETSSINSIGEIERIYEINGGVRIV